MIEKYRVFWSFFETAGEDLIVFVYDTESQALAETEGDYQICIFYGELLAAIIL